MTKVYLAGVVVLVGIIAFVSTSEDDKMMDTQDNQKSEVVTTNGKQEENHNITEDTNSDEKEQVVQDSTQKNVKVVSVDKNSDDFEKQPQPKNDTKKDAIVSYQKVYEYINDNDLKPMFEEPKVDKDGNEYNIYYKEPVKSSSSAILPPMMPNLVNISGTTVAVPSGVPTISKTTKNSSGEIILENYDITEDGAKKDEDVVIFSAPPQIGQNL
jgi:hypothetical protein